MPRIRRLCLVVPIITPQRTVWVWWFVAACLVAMSGWAAEPDAAAEPNFSQQQVAFYRQEVEPILQRHCYKCHGAVDDPKSHFRLTDRASILAGGDYGPAVLLDNPEESPLLTAVRYEELEMPPSGRLSDGEVEILARWVREGLPFPAERLMASERGHERHAAAVREEDRNYWAYQPVQRPDVPEVANTAWVRNPIDAFILARLEANGLRPAPMADGATLVRRVYYDLIGLPPTPEQIDAFLSDQSPGAYERLIDRLLASPQYGEKWGRHWLDVVRYGETNGYERDNPKPNVWRYRDYVIAAFNADKPYDRFVLEQIAGDELPDADADSWIATGFHRLGLWDDEPVDADQAYYDSLDDVVRTTAEAFLGMTIGCARCHDHKIDPIPQRDYYRLLAFFNNTFKDIRQLQFEKTAFTLNTQRVIASPEAQAAHRAQEQAHRQQLDQLSKEIAQWDERVFAALSPPEKEDAADAKVRRLLLAKYRPQVLSPDEVAQYDALVARLDALKNTRIPPLPEALVIRENGPTASPTHVLRRGSVHAPGEEVAPGFPEVLGFDDPPIPAPPPGAASCGRRLVLGRWLVDPRNPLTARVMVNRIWQHHFGRGIVRTPNDFGKAGRRPTHPKLLDWLASEFVARGWSIKSMHRLILTSSAYRMTSLASQDARAKDPTNDLFSHFNLRRLTAEEIRDTVLATTGRLNLKMGGPSVFTEIPAAVLAGASRPEAAWGKSPPQEQARRSIYIHVKRSLAEPVLRTFDSADSEASCAVRFTTTVPTQALTMLNGEFFNHRAGQFAERLRREAGPDPAAQIERAFRLALCRKPTSDERHRALALLEAWQTEDGLTAAEALRHFCLLIYNLNEFVYVD